MSDVDYPLINGRALDGASVKIKLLGSYWRGLQAITYGDALEPNYVYELGSVAPIAMTTGQYKPDDVSLEVLRERADAIREAFKQKAPKLGWGLVPFQIIIHYDDVGTVPVTDVLTGTRVIKAGNDAKAGADALIEKWTIRPLSLRRNGHYLYRPKVG
jgi:hypothetical protein